jgi:D-alanyl-D-alanine carboxypeptidase (penicillin-binding protein 5/6)
MFLITEYALENHGRFFKEIVSTVEYTIPPTQFNPDGLLINTNWLVRPVSGNPYYYDFAAGIKTGGFDEYFLRGEDGDWVRYDGIANLTSIARRDSFEYIVVTFNAPWHTNRTDGERGLHYAFLDHSALYQWAFSTFEYTRVMRPTDPFGSVRVIDGVEDTVTLYPQMDSEFWTLLPKNLDIASAIDKIPSFDVSEIPAPVEAGTILGTIELKLANQTLEKWSLVTTKRIEKTQSAQMVDNVNDFVNQPWFVPALVATAALTIALIILNYIRIHRKKSKSRRPPNSRIRR